MNFIKSKTIWFAILTTAAGVVDQIMPFIPQDKQGVVLAAVGILTGVLRTLTGKPLSEK